MAEEEHDLFSLPSEEVEEEVPWCDILIRRPDDIDAHQRAREQSLPKPTEVFASTYPQAGRDGEDIKLMMKGYRMGSDQTIISSGLTQWQASDVLCNYLLNSDEIKREKKRGLRLLELGSGLGRCGLLTHYLTQARDTSQSVYCTVLTDGDTNVLKLLRMNVVLNTSSDEDNISCQQLKWGKEEAKVFLSQQEYSSKFDMIIGSDLLYTNRSNILPLFETVHGLISNQGRGFIIAHNEEHLVPVGSLIWAAARKDLFCEVLRQEGQIHILCFKPTSTYSVNDMADRLCTKNTLLEAENRALKARLQLVEDKCLKLDERCTTLRGGKDLPKSILLSFDEDNLASILSFLESQDFASLASTCKLFGSKKHKIGDGNVSLMKKMVYKIIEGALPEEKEVLSLYEKEGSLFILYKELLQLRKPLKFDRLFGTGIQHAFGDKSIIKPKMRPGAVKCPTGRYVFACTAASNHVMRAGKHYATFMCSEQSGDPLWFGIVRPMKGFDKSRVSNTSFFTPFCTYTVDALRELQCPEWGDGTIHSCVYNATDGQCQWTDWSEDTDIFNESEDSDEDGEHNDSFVTEDWQGMQSFDGYGKIGLLLDYDEGTLRCIRMI